MRKQGLASLKLDDIWLAEMGFHDGRNPRLIDDEAEENFWQERAPDYSRTGNLYEEVPALRSKLLELLTSYDCVVEVGSGSGNFTVPIAEKVREVLGVEPSAAMLSAAERRVNEAGIKNVSFRHSKWEDFEPTVKADVVLSVNSLYRVRDINSALSKMNDTAARRCIIVRTVNRSPLYKLCPDDSDGFTARGDGLLFSHFLWRRGIYANAFYVTKERSVTYASLDDVHKDIPETLTAEEREAVLRCFLRQAHFSGEGYTYRFDSLYLILWWDK